MRENSETGAAAEAAGAYREFPLLLLDVPLDSAVEFDFATKLIAAAPDVIVTIPFGDLATLDRFKILGLEPVVLEPAGTSDLTALKRYVFATRQPPERRAVQEWAEEVNRTSAPGVRGPAARVSGEMDRGRRRAVV